MKLIDNQCLLDEPAVLPQRGPGLGSFGAQRFLYPCSVFGLAENRTRIPWACPISYQDVAPLGQGKVWLTVLGSRDVARFFYQTSPPPRRADLFCVALKAKNPVNFKLGTHSKERIKR